MKGQRLLELGTVMQSFAPFFAEAKNSLRTPCTWAGSRCFKTLKQNFLHRLQICIVKRKCRRSEFRSCKFNRFLTCIDTNDLVALPCKIIAHYSRTTSGIQCDLSRLSSLQMLKQTDFCAMPKPLSGSAVVHGIKLIISWY